MDKENYKKTHSPKVVKTILSALLLFAKKIRVGKSGPKNIIVCYHQITEVFDSVLSIQ